MSAFVPDLELVTIWDGVQHNRRAEPQSGKRRFLTPCQRTRCWADATESEQYLEAVPSRESTAPGAASCSGEPQSRSTKRQLGKLFRDEVRQQATCQHPNLMPLFDAGANALQGVESLEKQLYCDGDLASTLAR